MSYWVKQWVYFYVWKYRGKVRYVGASIDPKRRNDERLRGLRKDLIGRLVKKHQKDWELEILDIKVWDVPRGHYARAIENALIDQYQTHVKYHKDGLNLVYEQGKGPERPYGSFGLGVKRRTELHPALYRDSMARRHERLPELFVKTGKDLQAKYPGLGHHHRWHVARGMFKEGCRWCEKK